MCKNSFELKATLGTLLVINEFIVAIQAIDAYLNAIF